MLGNMTNFPNSVFPMPKSLILEMGLFSATKIKGDLKMQIIYIYIYIKSALIVYIYIYI